MQYGNNLNTSINALNTSEAASLADINRRRTDANNAYNSGLASANAQIEADYINNLLNERNKELERQMKEREYQESVRQYNLNKALQEREFNESVRQFNENLALQRQQLQSRFSGGSGGGGGYTTSNGEVVGSVNNTQAQKKSLPGYNDVKKGEIYFDTTGNKTVMRVKGATGTKKATAKKTTSKNTKKKTTTKNNPFPKKIF